MNVAERTRFLTVEEIAQQLGCSQASVYRAIRRAELRAFQLNESGDIRVTPEWLEDWINARSLTANAAALA